EAETRSRVPFRVGLVRTLRRWSTEEYQGGLLALSACFLAIALALAWEFGVQHPVMLAVLGALGMVPFSELAIQILNALITTLLPPEPAPKLDFQKGIPPEHATLVVVPMMLNSRKVICREAEKLEVRFLANRNEHLFYGLLGDFTDAPEE